MGQQVCVTEGRLLESSPSSLAFTDGSFIKLFSHESRNLDRSVNARLEPFRWLQLQVSPSATQRQLSAVRRSRFLGDPAMLHSLKESHWRTTSYSVGPNIRSSSQLLTTFLGTAVLAQAGIWIVSESYLQLWT